ncbi:hypothetical protein HD554DRAFT_2036093 [Boletus coccyginus]|nr:hypothetical protein HD554DRAFT_2036093 [Boletus coccyginus]
MPSANVYGIIVCARSSARPHPGQVGRHIHKVWMPHLKREAREDGLPQLWQMERFGLSARERAKRSMCGFARVELLWYDWRECCGHPNSSCPKCRLYHESKCDRDQSSHSTTTAMGPGHIGQCELVKEVPRIRQVYMIGGVLASHETPGRRTFSNVHQRSRLETKEVQEKRKGTTERRVTNSTSKHVKGACALYQLVQYRR